MKNKTTNKKPWEVMLEGSPYSRELEHQFEIDGYTKEGIEWWDNKSPEEVIQEVEEILGDLNVEKIIEHYTRLLNFVKDNNAEDAKSYVDNISDDIRLYEKVWNDTGKEW